MIPQGQTSIAARQAVLLGSTSGFFQGFAVSLPTVSLAGIAETFDVPDSLSPIEGAIFLIGLGSVLGALPTLWLERARRAKILLGSLVLVGVLSALSGIAPSLGLLTLLQVGVRAAAILVFATAVVLVTESSAARDRGRNVTAVVFAGSAGTVVALIARGGLDRAGISPQLNWRILFLFCLLSLLIPATAWRGVSQLEAHTGDSRGGVGAMRSMRASGDVGQFFQICGVFLFSYMGFMGAATWWASYATSEHSISSQDATVFVGVALAFGLAGYLTMGRLQDTIGRRRTAVMCLSGALVFGFGVFLSPGTLLMLSFLMAAAFFGLGASPVLTTLSAEVFPRRTRVAAVAIARGVFGTIGAVAGPLLVAVLANQTGGTVTGPREAALLVLAFLLPGILLIQMLPETVARDLDQIEASVEIPVASEPVVVAAAPFEPYRHPSNVTPRVTHPDPPE